MQTSNIARILQRVPSKNKLLQASKDIEQEVSSAYSPRMTNVAEITGNPRQLPDLVKQVQKGAEIILTEANKPVAKLVPVPSLTADKTPLPPLKIFAYSRPRVLIPTFTRAEIADEMFDR